MERRSLSPNEILTICIEFKVLDMLFLDTPGLVRDLKARGYDIDLREIEFARVTYGSLTSRPRNAVASALAPWVDKILLVTFVIVILGLMFAFLMGTVYLTVIDPAGVPFEAALTKGGSMVLAMATYAVTVYVAIRLLFVIVSHSLKGAVDMALFGLLVLLILWIKGSSPAYIAEDPSLFLRSIGVVLVAIFSVKVLEKVIDHG